jgi:hypothetical protein
MKTVPKPASLPDEAVETVESALDALLERRSKERQEANKRAEMWRESVRCYEARGKEARREEWISHHLTLERVHLEIAEDHRKLAEHLLGGEAMS